MITIDQTMVWRYFFEFLIFVPGAVIALFPLHRDLRDRSAFGVVSMFIILLTVIILGSMAWARYTLRADLFLLFSTPSIFLLFTVMVRKEFEKKLFCFANAFLLSSFCCLYSRFIMAQPEQYNDQPVFLLETSYTNLIIAAIITVVFLFTVRREITKMMFDPQLNYIWKWLTLIPIFVSVLVLWINPVDISTVLVGRVRIIALISLLLIPFGSLGLYHLIYSLVMRLSENAELTRENELLRMEEKRYETLRMFNDQTRAVRHDMRQHLLAINRLAESNQNDKIVKYIAPLMQTVTDTNKHFCANMIIDAVASHYDSIAEEQNTEIEWKLNLPRELAFHDSDICSIMGNLVENALNAVRSLPVSQRKVTAAASMLSDEMLGISVKNPYEGKIRFGRNGLPRNSRPGHGIGLSSVSMIAHKYNGTLDLSISGGVFSAGVLLYAPKTDTSEDQDISS